MQIVEENIQKVHFSFEDLMRKYKDQYWTLKNQDSIWNLVNHNYYLFLRKGQENSKENVTVSPYNLDGTKLLLTMTQGKEKSFNNRIKKLKEKGLIGFVSSSSDDGGSVTFAGSDLAIVAEVFKIKKKQKRELTEQQRQELSDRAKKMFNK